MLASAYKQLFRPLCSLGMTSAYGLPWYIASSRSTTNTSVPEASTSANPQSPKPSDAGLQFSSGARKVVRLGGKRVAGSGPTLHGVVHVCNSNNNCILTLTDTSGLVKAWASSGSVGFRNARKSLPVAAEKAAEELAKKAMKLGYGSASVKLKGVGNNKQYVVQSLAANGMQLTRLTDVTPIPYNGCRRPKRRRV